MATMKKRAPKAAKPASSPKPATWSGDFADAPMFYFFPPGDDHSFLGGVVRKTYKAHTHSAVSFSLGKLHPIEPADAAGSWNPTAEDFEMVLPADGDDAYRNAQLAMMKFDAEALPHKQAVMAYFTLKFPGDRSLQRGWEIARSFAFRNFALRRQLATLVVQHAPHKMGSANPPHVHLLVLPRKLTALGFGVFDDHLTSDAGIEQVYREWTAFNRRFSG
jgi:hypothetical protein